LLISKTRIIIFFVKCTASLYPFLLIKSQPEIVRVVEQCKHPLHGKMLRFIKLHDKAGVHHKKINIGQLLTYLSLAQTNGEMDRSQKFAQGLD